MQKRTNPLEQPTPVEEPVTIEQIAPVSEPAVVLTPEEPKLKMQKRTNPLTLEAQNKPARKPAPQKAKPSYIEGKAKKKFVLTFLNKSLVVTAQTVSGKPLAEILETALLQYLYSEQPKAYDALVEAIKNNGCEIKWNIPIFVKKAV